MINRFILNEVSYFGPGAREVLPKEITRLGLHKAFWQLIKILSNTEWRIKY